MSVPFSNSVNNTKSGVSSRTVWGISESVNRLRVSTSPILARGIDNDEVDIITAEIVVGVNVLRDFLARVRHEVGGRSGSMQKVLREARETVLVELRTEAMRLSWDAVVAVDLDYQEISGGGKSILIIVASGTAVRKAS